MRWKAPSLLVCLLLAGCTDPAGPEELPDDPNAETETASGAPDAAAADNAPRPWRVGDWWKYKFTSVTAGIEPFDLTVVVAAETADAYHLSSPDGDVLNVTFFTHVPALGPVRKSDSAVTRHGHFTPYFRFPLQEEQAWEVEVRGPWTAEAKRMTYSGLGTAHPAWHIEYRGEGGNLVYAIDWSAQANWILREAAYFGPEPSHVLELQDWGHNWTGTVRTYAVADLLVGPHVFNGTQAPQEAAGAEGFEVPEGVDWVLLGAFFGGGNGYCSHQFLSPPPGTETTGTTEPCGDNQLQWSGRRAVPGTWHFTWAFASPAAYMFAEAFRVNAEPVTLA